MTEEVSRSFQIMKKKKKKKTSTVIIILAFSPSLILIILNDLKLRKMRRRIFKKPRKKHSVYAKPPENVFTDILNVGS